MLKTPTTDQDLYKELKYVIATRKKEKVEKFIAANPNIMAVIGPDNKSILQVAFCFFHLEIVKLILFQSFNINNRDTDGYTALTDALMEGNLEAITLLLQAGALLDETHPIDRTAKTYAIRKNTVIAELLEKASRGELVPLVGASPPTTETDSSDDERKDILAEEIRSAVAAETELMPSIKKGDSEVSGFLPSTSTQTSSWFGFLKHRNTSASAKVEPISASLEMTRIGAPPATALAEHPHID
jgi:ankyrin repeat protein